MEHSRSGAALASLAAGSEPAVVYGITAVRMENGQVSWVMMGMLALLRQAKPDAKIGEAAH